MAEKEKDRRLCLDILSRETIPSLACRLNVPNFFTLPEYDGAVFKSPTFQFEDATWFFEFQSDDRWQRKDKHTECGLRKFDVNLIRLNSVIQQEIFHIAILIDANNKNFDYNSSIFKEDKNKVYLASFRNDDPPFDRSQSVRLIIQLFCEKSSVSDEDEIQDTTNGGLETETTKAEKNFNVTLELSTRKSISSVACTLKIPNFFILPEYDGTTFESRTLAFANAAWFFRFSTKNRWKSEDDIRDKEIYFDVDMIRLNSEIPEQCICYKIALLDKNDKEYQKEIDCDLFMEDNIVHFISSFNNTESCLDRRDSLTLSIRLFYDKSTEKEVCQLQNTTQRGVETLLRNLKSLLLDEQSCDVLFKVENRDFKAHKTILRARSPVFASMFQPHTKESSTGVVDILDCSASVFEILLLHIYTGSADAISSDIVFDLYYAADKYQMDNLKSECVDYMENNLSVDNFCEIMKFSLLHNVRGLKENAIEFFCANVKTIIKTVQWQKYLKDYTTQANELYTKAINS